MRNDELSQKTINQPKTTILQGDCLSWLKELPANSVHTCVTSPPYWGLRDYGNKGQLGLEKTPEEYVGRMVEVFHEVKRVLRGDGTLWLNLGDCYNAGRDGGHAGGGNQGRHKKYVQRCGANAPDLKPKDLVGIPWRVAFALQADGWYLRQDIIWHKPNPMPESVRDRCTKAHEYIFLLSKAPKYYFDHEAIKEPSVEFARQGERKREKFNGESFVDTKKRGWGSNCGVSATRNKRSVWTVTTKPFRGAHFATFPQDLIEPCVLAGCPEGGIVLDPFLGAGTTALVSAVNGRGCIGIELNPEYVAIARKRIEHVG